MIVEALELGEIHRSLLVVVFQRADYDAFCFVFIQWQFFFLLCLNTVCRNFLY